MRNAPHTHTCTRQKYGRMQSMKNPGLMYENFGTLKKIGKTLSERIHDSNLLTFPFNLTSVFFIVVEKEATFRNKVTTRNTRIFLCRKVCQFFLSYSQYFHMIQSCLCSKITKNHLPTYLATLDLVFGLILALTESLSKLSSSSCSSSAPLQQTTRTAA